MKRQVMTIDKKSGINNDTNCIEVEAMEIVQGVPELGIDCVIKDH